jgi:hypothetical protein
MNLKIILIIPSTIITLTFTECLLSVRHNSDVLDALIDCRLVITAGCKCYHFYLSHKGKVIYTLSNLSKFIEPDMDRSRI